MDFFPSLFQEKKFIDTVEKLTIFIEEKNIQNEFMNIYLKDESGESVKIIIAKKGFLLESGENRTLRLLDGKFISINETGNTTSFNFQKTDFNLSKFLTKTTTTKKLQELNILSLVRCMNYILIKKKAYPRTDINCNKESINEIISEIYTRLFKPFFLFTLSSVVIFLLTTNYENKNFKTIKVIIFFMGIVTIIVSEIMSTYSGKSNLSTLISISLPLIIFLISYIIFFRKVNYESIKI